MDQQEYWNNFIKTGRVSDYLDYKNAAAGNGVTALEADNRGISDMGNQNG